MPRLVVSIKANALPITFEQVIEWRRQYDRWLMESIDYGEASISVRTYIENKDRSNQSVLSVIE